MAFFYGDFVMSGMFGGSPKTPNIQPVEEAPQVVDTTDKVREEEQGRKKRRGVASQIVSGADLSGVQVSKKSLGA